MLKLYEELLLLALNETKGKISDSILLPLRFGLAGSLLAELTLWNRIIIQDKRVYVLDPAIVEDEIVDDAFEVIKSSERPRKTAVWVQALSEHPKKFQKRVADRLVEKGVLRKEEKRYFWVFPDETYQQKDPASKYQIKQRLRAVALGGEAVESRTVSLLSLVRASRLLEYVFTLDEIHQANLRIDSLVHDEAIGTAVSDTIDMIEAATMAVYMESVG